MDDLFEITLDDPRVTPAWRASDDVADLLRQGARLYWDTADCRVRLIKPSDGEWHSVPVKDALPKQQARREQRKWKYRQLFNRFRLN